MASSPGPHESYSGKREPNSPLLQGFPNNEMDILLEVKMHKVLWCLDPELQKDVTFLLVKNAEKKGQFDSLFPEYYS